MEAYEAMDGISFGYSIMRMDKALALTGGFDWNDMHGGRIHRRGQLRCGLPKAYLEIIVKYGVFPACYL